jgi:hypothetical protein
MQGEKTTCLCLNTKVLLLQTLALDLLQLAASLKLARCHWQGRTGVAGFWRRTGTAVNLCSAVQQRSGSRPTPGRGGIQAARRRVPRRATVLLRKRSWPANRATLHSALAQAIMALHEPTNEASCWMGETTKGRGRRTVQQGVRRGSSARLYR